MCVCGCVYVCLRMHAFMHASVYLCMCVHVHVCVHAFVHARVYSCMCVCVRVLATVAGAMG